MQHLPMKLDIRTGTKAVYGAYFCTYSQSRSTVIAVIGDNVSINQRLASDLFKPFFGCKGHHFNFNMNDMIKAT